MQNAGLVNKRTMELVGEDDLSHPVYKCVETNILYKDIMLGYCETPVLYSCGNKMDGEPDCPISPELELQFIKNEEVPTKEEKFNYKMLHRLKMDCDYFLGYGNRNKKHLYYEDEQEQIDKMKELHSGFSDGKKPEWLTFEQIERYESLMIKKEKSQLPDVKTNDFTAISMQILGGM